MQRRVALQKRAAAGAQVLPTQGIFVTAEGLRKCGGYATLYKLLFENLMNRWTVLRLLVQQLCDELFELFGVVTLNGFVCALGDLDEVGSSIYDLVIGLLEAANGFLRVQSSYRMHPRLQISDFWL